MRWPVPWPVTRGRGGAHHRIPTEPFRNAGRLAMPLALALITAGGTAAAQDSADTGFSGGITLESGDGEESPAQPEEAPEADVAAGDDGNWWQAQPDGAALRLMHAGAFTNAPDDAPAIALLFSGPFEENGAFDDYLAVYDRDGDPVAGRWRVAASERVLYFTLPSAGTYVVRLRAGLPDADGNRLPQSLSGPVHVP